MINKKKEISIIPQIEDTDNALKITLTASIPTSEMGDSIGQVLAYTKRMGIPAVDWEIENRAKALGFKDTQDLLEECGRIIRLDLYTNYTNATGKLKSKPLGYSMQQLFGVRIIVEDRY